MKTLLFSFMLLLAVPFSTNCQSERVYICTGSSSKAYHRTSYCRGLNNCRASVKAVSKATAVQMGRVPCKICYWYSGVCGDSFCYFVCAWRVAWYGPKSISSEIFMSLPIPSMAPRFSLPKARWRTVRRFCILRRWRRGRMKRPSPGRHPIFIKLTIPIITLRRSSVMNIVTPRR